MTKKEIDARIDELRLAYYEDLEASKAEQDSKLRKIKAHYRLNQARIAVSNIREDYGQDLSKI